MAKKPAQPLPLAATTVEALPNRITMLDPASVKASPYQCRLFVAKSPAYRELVASVAAIGVFQPVTVRVNTTDNETEYELVFGERRWRAAMETGRELPAMVRNLSNDEAMLLVVAENDQREDLTPLEQGESIQMLLTAGMKAEDVAQSLGHSPEWVYRMARITKLEPDWKEAVRETLDNKYGPQINRWSMRQLEEVARLPRETQERLFTHCKDTERYRLTLDDLRRVIGNLTRLLGKAPFPLDADGVCKGVGSCEACPKRTGMNHTLFGLAAGTPAATDTCLDDKCFNRKLESFARSTYRDEKLKAVAAGKGVGVVEVKQGRTYTGADTFTSKGVEFEVAKRGVEGAVLGVVTSKSAAGRKVWLLPKPEPQPGTERRSIEDQRLRHIRAQQGKALKAFQAALKTFKANPERLEFVATARMLLCWGGRIAPQGDKARGLPESEVLQELWDAFLQTRIADLDGCEDLWCDTAKGMKVAQALAVELDMDFGLEFLAPVENAHSLPEALRPAPRKGKRKLEIAKPEPEGVEDEEAPLPSTGLSEDESESESEDESESEEAAPAKPARKRRVRVVAEE